MILIRRPSVNDGLCSPTLFSPPALPTLPLGFTCANLRSPSAPLPCLSLKKMSHPIPFSAQCYFVLPPTKRFHASRRDTGQQPTCPLFLFFRPPVAWHRVRPHCLLIDDEYPGSLVRTCGGVLNPGAKASRMRVSTTRMTRSEDGCINFFGIGVQQTFECKVTVQDDCFCSDGSSSEDFLAAQVQTSSPLRRRRLTLLHPHCCIPLVKKKNSLPTGSSPCVQQPISARHQDVKVTSGP